MDGEVYEFGKGSGGGIPTLGVDFTYTGDCEVISEIDGYWKIKFYTSGTFGWLTTPPPIDIFLVGGGGGGASSSSFQFGAGGGGGGYTLTKTNIQLSVAPYNILIGSGGANASGNGGEGGNGGITSAFEFTANPGKGGIMKLSDNGGGRGGSGGSGGGSGYPHNSAQPGVGGSDGSDGGYSYSKGYCPGGTGQGTSTREFEDSAGTLYSGGGAGYTGYNFITASGGEGGGGASGAPGINGTANTGGGGGAGSGRSKDSKESGSGGSGIVIIRNTKYPGGIPEPQIPLSGDLVVGNTVTFDDKEWLVVHNDGNLWYLALSKLPEGYRITSPGSNSSGKYVGSTIETKVIAWETANLSELALQFCEDVTVENATHKVFLPTYTQVKTTFSHYAAAEANRICTVYINNTDTKYDWWVSTPAGSAYWYQVTDVGKLQQYSNSGSAAIRPHVCIKYET